MTERLVDEASELRGRCVTDVDAPVLAIRRANGETMTNPEPTTRLDVGDVVLLLDT